MAIVVQRFKRAFFAYPSAPGNLISPIVAAAQLVTDRDPKVGLTTWPQLDIFGASIPHEVRSRIDEVDVVVCDITLANMNVYYEIGFAIGRGKAIAPVINASFANAVMEIRRDG